MITVGCSPVTQLSARWTFAPGAHGTALGSASAGLPTPRFKTCAPVITVPTWPLSSVRFSVFSRPIATESNSPWLHPRRSDTPTGFVCVINREMSVKTGPHTIPSKSSRWPRGTRRSRTIHSAADHTAGGDTRHAAAVGNWELGGGVCGPAVAEHQEPSTPEHQGPSTPRGPIGGHPSQWPIRGLDAHLRHRPRGWLLSGGPTRTSPRTAGVASYPHAPVAAFAARLSRRAGTSGAAPAPSPRPDGWPRISPRASFEFCPKCSLTTRATASGYQTAMHPSS
jgi:hypothetical protein